MPAKSTKATAKQSATGTAAVSTKATRAAKRAPRTAQDVTATPGTTVATAARVASSARNADRGPTVPLPVLHAQITLPAPDRLAFYAAVAAMTAIELIDWPVALIVAAGHAIATRSRNRAVSELAEGMETAA